MNEAHNKKCAHGCGQPVAFEGQACHACLTQKHAAETPTMRVICAWCGLIMQKGSMQDVSHGICPACEIGVRTQTRGLAKARWRAA